MTATFPASVPTTVASVSTDPLKLLKINYRNNTQSDYTECIEHLDRAFRYADHQTHYWCEPEQSLLYGTPLYQNASDRQRTILNHLAWVSQYNTTAQSETETIHYNYITAGSFAAVGQDYAVVAEQLDLEALQERRHIHAFYKVNHQTLKALMGKQAFTSVIPSQASSNWQQWMTSTQSALLRGVAKVMLKGQQSYYSPYLGDLEATQKLPTSTHGFLNGFGAMPLAWGEFFSINWGSSPFLASQYYTLRYMANMLLKQTERRIFRYYKKLERQHAVIPAPTAISYYHFLDESFHTTTSLFLSRDIYHQLPQPSAYEKWVINQAVTRLQRYNLSGLSGVMSSRFYPDDIPAMAYVYKLLTSPVFDLNKYEALHELEKCFCREHVGFHQALDRRQALHQEMRKFADRLEHLSPANREMRVMANGQTISEALAANRRQFSKFTHMITNI